MRPCLLWSGILFLCCLSGCGSLHLYNEGADKTAAAASADYENSKLGETLAKQRSILDALERKEIESFRVLTLARRDAALLAVMQGAEIPRQAARIGDGFVPQLAKLIDARLRVLDGDPAQRWPEQREAARNEALLRAEILKTEAAMLLVGDYIRQLPAPPCSAEVAGLKENNAEASRYSQLVRADAKQARRLAVIWPAMGPEVSKYAAACEKQLTQQKLVDEFKASSNSELDRALRDAGDRGKAIAEKAKQLVTARVELAEATKELAAASANNAALTNPASYTCPEKGAGAPPPEVDKLCKAIARLEKLGDAGVKFLAEEKIARVNDLLAALSGVDPQGGNGETDESLAFLAAATRLRHGLHLYRQSRALPALEPLIIEKQIAAAELAYANAALQLEQRRRAHAAELVDAIRQEIAILNEAGNTLGGFHDRVGTGCAGTNSVYCDSVEAMLAKGANDKGPPLVRRTAYRAMALFAESYSTARDRQQTARIRLASADYHEAMIRSEAAVASWQAIIDTPVAQLRQYHAGGFRTETAIALLQALGVVGIATK